MLKKQYEVCFGEEVIYAESYEEAKKLAKKVAGSSVYEVERRLVYETPHTFYEVYVVDEDKPDRDIEGVEIWIGVDSAEMVGYTKSGRTFYVFDIDVSTELQTTDCDFIEKFTGHYIGAVTDLENAELLIKEFNELWDVRDSIEETGARLQEIGLTSADLYRNINEAISNVDDSVIAIVGKYCIDSPLRDEVVHEAMGLLR